MSKKKLFIIPIVLLLCLALLVVASFAWLNMSRTPEISGIDTQVGANGNLEIALLDNNTYMYPDEIASGVGNSAAAITVHQSNITWGNLVDLSDESYGLHDVSLLPSRLNLSTYDEGRGVVNGNMLMVPSYSVDGRLQNFYSDTVSATFSGSDFTYYTDQHSYGVRGIGSILELSPQQAALTNSRSLVRSYQSAAYNAVTSIWNANGTQLFDMIYRADIGETKFSKADVAILRDTATRTYGALGYVDSALRQGIVGAVSTCEASHSTFKMLRQEIEDGQKLLSDIIANKISEQYKKTNWNWNEFYSWAVVVESDKAQMKSVMVECDKLTDSGESFTWEQISPIYNKLLNEYGTYYNDEYLEWILRNTYYNMALNDVNYLTLTSGPLFNIANYIGKYELLLTYTADVAIEVKTIGDPYPYLEDFSEKLDSEDASGSYYGSSAVLDDVYGYAIDLAFRTNAKSNLMLQIDPDMRVDAGEAGTQVQGNGSYMSFSSKYLNEEQVVTMMDAVRVGFLDNRNILVGLAKLNTSNYTEEDGTVKASLYMYEYRLSSDGSISMGERRSEDSKILSLEKATPTIITAIVWLDGDHTDNSIASSLGYSLTGKLNLQFSSDAELKPAGSEAVGGDSSEETTVPEDTTVSEDTSVPENPADPEVIPDRPSGNDEIVASGHVSDTINWAYHSNGCLEITGTGDMPDYESYTAQPWGDYRHNIKSIKVSEGITSFGNYSFGSCSCDVVEIPDSVESIGIPNFAYASRPYVYYGGSEQKWNSIGFVDRAEWGYGDVVSFDKADASLYKSGSVSSNITWELYNDGVLKINGTGAMPDFSETTKPSWMDYEDKIKYVDIAEGIENVGAYAFANSSKLITVKIPTTVKVISSHSFYKSASLKAVAVRKGSGLTTVEAFAFGYCPELIHINVGRFANDIGSDAFTECSNLNYFDFYKVKKIGENAFQGCVSLKEATIPFGVTILYDGTFSRCYGMKSIEIPITVTRISTYALFNAGNDNGEYSLVINYKGTSEMWDSVDGSEYLSNHNVIYSDQIIDHGVVNSTVNWMLDDSGCLFIYGYGAIDDYPDDMFSKPWGDYLSDIDSVKISEGITSIGANSFSYSNIYRIEIPVSVEFISWSAVNNCSYLNDISYAGTLAEYNAIVTDGTPPDVNVYTN